MTGLLDALAEEHPGLPGEEEPRERLLHLLTELVTAGLLRDVDRPGGR